MTKYQIETTVQVAINAYAAQVSAGHWSLAEYTERLRLLDLWAELETHRIGKPS